MFLFLFVPLGGAALAAAAVLSEPRWPQNGLHLPLYRTVTRRATKRDAGTAAVGLGDVLDVTYNVLVEVGGVATPLVFDSGSADLWVISDACTGSCTAGVPLYPQSTFQPSGMDVHLLYGDSHTGTHAIGPIGKDRAGLAGLNTNDQYFAAITDTNTTVLDTGSAGIFGIGFPPISVLWRQLLQAELKQNPPSAQSHAKRVEPPVLAATLQRDTVDVGGNVGQLSIGALPNGISDDALTWAPLRAYTVAEGGLPPPPDAPSEVYPLVWEIPLDDVYFNGVKLGRSKLSPANISLSALIDTGNSLIRGPQDVLNQIQSMLTSSSGSGTFPCSEPQNLTFQIGGKLFPVDPRDFVHQTFTDSVDVCSPALAVTDPPTQGSGFLYGWSLGDPLLKSVLVAFHYGNLTHPSQDPPRIGLLSTLPSDASDKLQAVVGQAQAGDGNFIVTSEPAPSGTFLPTSVGVGGVPQATRLQPGPDQPQTTSDSSSALSSLSYSSESQRHTLVVALGTLLLGLGLLGI
ncbi:hypothetical protein EIP91_009424 [Steccherinum ochraceum]|uniref:Peptidase A1 domain-containing protein n=1 Tax=Steccherinum ochraceum TaxID=92696 RepID=A0A4R0R724_9APHY|nr:hypothetical protein EIP91_009424 [Steccherinum ochraceum]